MICFDVFDSGLFIKNGKVVSHRSVLTVLFNPLLRRLFGLAIASKISDNQEFSGYTFIKQKEPISWNFKFDGEYDYKINCKGKVPFKERSVNYRSTKKKEDHE